MLATDVSLLEQIANEFNRGEGIRNPQELLGLINQYYISQDKSIISNLDDVKAEHATEGLGGILGFKYGQPNLMKQRLAEFEVFSEKLADYSTEVLEKIVGNVIKNVSNHRFSSFYLAEANPYAEENKKAIAASKQMKEYLFSIGVSHLDDVKAEHATMGLGGVLGFKYNQPKRMKQRLAEFEVFSENLADYSTEVLEKIVENVIDNISTPKFSSFYTSMDLNPNVLESNRRNILASEAVQRFFREQGYSMDDPSTMTKEVELFLNKYFRTKNIEDALKPQEETPRYRVIHKEWNPEEEKILQNAYERFGRDESNFMIMLNLSKESLQELFGVSYNAIIQKCKYMGLIPSIELGGTRENGTPKYVFPSIHAEEFPDLAKGFENYAALLARGIIPAATPTFAFESATHEQFHHVTLPVRYNGVDVNDYNNSEQAIISAAWHYISGNEKFPRNERGDVIIDPTIEHGLEPVMLQIQGEYNSLVQLIFRRKFNQDNEVATAAIGLSGINPKEIYLFKHETHATYQNTRV